MNRRLLPGVLVLLLSGAALLAPDPQAEAGPLGPGVPLFFAMEIQDEAGAVLAEPKLVGRDRVPLEMTLADPGGAGDEPRMSLWLQPESASDGSYEVCFEISVPGRVERGKGKVRVRPGEERRAKVRYPGGHLVVQLAAFSVPSAELELFLEHGAARRGPGRT